MELEPEKSIFESKSWIEFLEKLQRPMRVRIHNSRKNILGVQRMHTIHEFNRKSPVNNIPGRESRLSRKYIFPLFLIA